MFKVETVDYYFYDNRKNNGANMDSITMTIINSYLIISGAMATVLVIALLLKLLERTFN